MDFKVLYVAVGLAGCFNFFYIYYITGLCLDKELPVVFISKEMLNYKIRIPENLDKDKYMIYTCRQPPCGGWADRRKGMIGAFLMSLLSNRTFGIIHTYPVDITDYWVPKYIDWNIPMSDLKGKTEMTFNALDDSKFVKSLSNVSFPDIFKEDVIYYTGNLDILDELRRHLGVQIACPWLGKMADCDVYANLWDALFQSTKILTKEIDSFFTNQVGRNKLACAHIRLGQNPTIPEDVGDTDYRTFFKLKNIQNIWNFFDVSTDSSYKLFIASDSEAVKENSKQRFKMRIVDTGGKITHVDRTRTVEDMDSGFKKAMLEFVILSKCDFLVLTLSGFGIHAAYNRHTSDNLYCVYRDRVIPCSRGTLRLLYQTL